MKMKQFKVFNDFEQEEQYLNEMAQKGFELEKRSVFGRYYFKKTAPQNSSYKVDYRIFHKRSDLNDYISIFEDSGWKHIFGTVSSGQQYFLPMSDNASVDIFSDEKSRAERYTRLKKRFYEWTLAMIMAIIGVLISIGFNLSRLFFLTPGIWERQGAEFWSAFWFEFPFVLMRVFPIAFCAIVAYIGEAST